MTRLSPEREAEIRRNISAAVNYSPVDWYSCARDLLAEIDALREERRQAASVLFDCRCAIEALAERAAKSGVMFAGKTARGLIERIDAVPEGLSSSHH